MKVIHIDIWRKSIEEDSFWIWKSIHEEIQLTKKVDNRLIWVLMMYGHTNGQC